MEVSVKTKIQPGLTWFYLEFFKLSPELPLILLAFSLMGIGIAFVGYDYPQKRELVSIVLCLLLPLAVSVLGNTVVLREFSADTYFFPYTRQRIFTIWLRRTGLLFVSVALFLVIIVALINLLFPGLFPPILAITLLVPSLLMTSLVSLISALTASATAGLLVGLFLWSLTVVLFRYVFGLLTSRFHPFLEWIIYKNLAPMDALLVNKIFLTSVSLVLLAFTGLRYWYFDKFNSNVSE